MTFASARTGAEDAAPACTPFGAWAEEFERVNADDTWGPDWAYANKDGPMTLSVDGDRGVMTSPGGVGPSALAQVLQLTTYPFAAMDPAGNPFWTVTLRLTIADISQGWAKFSVMEPESIGFGAYLMYGADSASPGTINSFAPFTYASGEPTIVKITNTPDAQTVKIWQVALGEGSATETASFVAPFALTPDAFIYVEHLNAGGAGALTVIPANEVVFDYVRAQSGCE